MYFHFIYLSDIDFNRARKVILPFLFYLFFLSARIEMKIKNTKKFKPFKVCKKCSLKISLC